MNKEAMIFIYIYFSYFGFTLDNTTQGKCILA